MDIIIHNHYHYPENIEQHFHSLINKLDKIMTEQEQLAEDLKAVSAQIHKIGNESAKTLQKVTELETQLANQPNLIPEVKDAFTNLKNQVQLVDDLVPDAAPTGDAPAAP